ncbi:hypothetical protein BS50DRAFT_70439 [Corynespora cassiicola Philippines]|uniref:Uncharacterized protein n=1 Tax=Corynespora cassiicola Philippines TaxID=1448308 RepID=A0A2T2NG10_CORCC|nr:hypothetical protein BS50DRAFT_70439 [Corynespora cassiicola Philippines]
MTTVCPRLGPRKNKTSPPAPPAVCPSACPLGWLPLLLLLLLLLSASAPAGHVEHTPARCRCRFSRTGRLGCQLAEFLPRCSPSLPAAPTPRLLSGALLEPRCTPRVPATAFYLEQTPARPCRDLCLLTLIPNPALPHSSSPVLGAAATRPGAISRHLHKTALPTHTLSLLSIDYDTVSMPS